MRTPAARFLPLLLLGLFATPGTLAAAGDADYHLTGIIGSDSGAAFAVIETADGQQQLVREGSSIGPGYVKSISSGHRTVVLALPTGEISLRLTGSATHEEIRREFSIDDYDDQVEQIELEPTALPKLLALARNPKKFDETQLTLKLNQLLGLREQAQIAAYDRQAVGSASDLLDKLATQIAGMTEDANFLGTIAVSDQDGQRRVYISVKQAADQQP